MDSFTSSSKPPEFWVKVQEHAHAVQQGTAPMNVPEPVFELQKLDKRALNQCFDTEQAKHYEGMTLETFNVVVIEEKSPASVQAYRAILNIIDGYLRNWEKVQANGAGLYFWSESAGSGKTMLACVVANMLYTKYGVSSQIITMAAIFRLLKEVYNSNGSLSEDRVFNMVKYVPLLIIDEIGYEDQETPWKRDMVYEIVDVRYNIKKPVLFTSNLPIESLPYHQRVHSRIQEMAVQIDFPDFDYRTVKGDQREQELKQMILG